MTAIEQRRVTAIHEAGHAVIARRLGVNVAIAALFPPNSMDDGGVEAESQMSKTNGLSTEAVEIDIKVALAGIAAQRRAFPDSVGDKDGEEDWGIIQDGVARIVYIMNGLTLPDDEAAFVLSDEMCDIADRIYKQLTAETDILVTKCWPAIERVAEAIMQYPHTLNQSEIDALMAPSRR